MRHLLILAALCLAGCASEPPQYSQIASQLREYETTPETPYAPVVATTLELIQQRTYRMDDDMRQQEMERQAWESINRLNL
jgi:PBP1b-binding outer membrane lipoprotein LpoB